MIQDIETAEDIIQYDIYLSGPMSGYDEYNFPLFNRVAKELRDEGHTVLNPAETLNGDTSQAYSDYLRIDTIAIARSKGIMMLPGWRRSRGACYEYLLAKSFKLEIDKYKFRHRGDNSSGSKQPYRVALLGYARTGKDTVGKILINNEGYNRVAIGDHIKSQLDPVIQAYLGHSAFTEDDELKENVRPTYVEWGFSNYDNILAEFMEDIPKRAVNTRLYRFKEALKWKGLEGSELWLVKRPGHGPREPKVKEELDQIIDAGMVDRIINNDQCLEALEYKVNHSLAALRG